MKYCYKCKQEKEESEFYKTKSKKTGFSDECKECIKAIRKHYYKNNKEKIKAYEKRRYHSGPRQKYMQKYNKENYGKLIERHKATRQKNKLKLIEIKGNKCERCGGVFPPYVYDLHHKDPSIKRHTPSKILGLSWKNIIKELDGCMLLCANCHRMVHNESA